MATHSRHARARRKAPDPLGKGKQGANARMIRSSGGGKKTLKTLKSLSRSHRKSLRQASDRSGTGLTQLIRNIRGGRVKAGRRPTSGKPFRVRIAK